MTHPTTCRRLVLWRHGRTAWNAENRAQGQIDVPMDAIGHQQARAAAPVIAEFAPAALWSSDLRRAIDSAAYVSAATGLTVRTDARLREYAAGMREGYTFDEFKIAHPFEHQNFFGDPDYHVPGAETVTEVRARMTAALSDIVDALPPGETAVVVSHGAALTAGILGFFSAPTGLREMFSGMANCAWAVLAEHPARGWQLVAYNTAMTEMHAATVENADSPAAHTPGQ